MISRPELDWDPPIGLDRDSECDMSGFASIPRLLTIKPKNFPAETPKAHFAGFNFIL